MLELEGELFDKFRIDVSLSTASLLITVNVPQGQLVFNSNLAKLLAVNRMVAGPILVTNKNPIDLSFHKRLDIHLSEISTHDNLLNERGTQYFGLCQQVKDCVLY